MTVPVMTVRHLSKTIKSRQILRDISFEIHKGDCIALIGPNGAGKTTLMKCLLGDLQTTSNSISVYGLSPMDRQLKTRVGVLYQENLIDSDLTVKEIIDFQRAIYPNPLSIEGIDHLLGFTNTQKMQFADKLSGGQRRLLSFVRMLIGRPDVIVLDEPTAGMDTNTRKRFWEMIGNLKASGITILYSSHYIEEVEHTADRILVLDRGQLVRDTTPYDLQREDCEKVFSFPSDYLNPIQQEAVYEIVTSSHRTSLVTKDPETVLKKLLTAGCQVSDIEMTNRSLLSTLFMKVGTNHERDESFTKA